MFSSQNMKRLVALRQIAQALCAEGKLADLENRPADAAASYMNGVLLGAKSNHGGVLIDGLIAMACEGMGAVYLAADIEKLNAQQLRKLVHRLEEVEAEQEPMDKILSQEKRWIIHELSSIEGIREYARQGWEAKSFLPDRENQRKIAARYPALIARVTQLKAKAAARAYLLEHRSTATNWNDLNPACLKSAPGVSFVPNDTNKLIFSTH